MDLINTSQGSQLDVPPKDWIRSELKQFGAVDSGKTWKLDLKGKLHPFFHKKRWPTLAPERFAALEQSFQLSTRLLQIAGPYLCNFFPQRFLLDHVYADEIDEGGWFDDEAITRRLILDDKRTIKEINEAHRLLKSIVDDIEWHEHLTMVKEHHSWGSCHRGTSDPRGKLHHSNDIDWLTAGEAAKEAGLKRRPVKIAITSSFVDAILASKKGSDQHMTAVFQAAITITHEIGHAIYLTDFDCDCRHMYIGNDINPEAGLSFTAWLFDGWLPTAIFLDKTGEREDYPTFNSGLDWTKMHRKPVVKPRTEYTYSVRLEHVQRMLSQSEWARFDLLRESRKVRSNLLKPKTPFENGKHARRAHEIHQGYWHYDWSGYISVKPDLWDLMVPFDKDWTDGTRVRDPNKGKYRGAWPEDHGGRVEVIPPGSKPYPQLDYLATDSDHGSEGLRAVERFKEEYDRMTRLPKEEKREHRNSLPKSRKGSCVENPSSEVIPRPKSMKDPRKPEQQIQSPKNGAGQIPRHHYPVSLPDLGPHPIDCGPRIIYADQGRPIHEQDPETKKPKAVKPTPKEPAKPSKTPRAPTLSTARNTRSKRSVAELGVDELEKVKKRPRARD